MAVRVPSCLAHALPADSRKGSRQSRPNDERKGQVLAARLCENSTLEATEGRHLATFCGLETFCFGRAGE